jgi:iron only hydrogenase large subunit-like protein
VLTFEELSGMFDAKGVDFNTIEESPINPPATGAGRGYAVAGGVAAAIEEVLHEYYPDTEVKIQHAEGLADCKKALLMAKAGKLKGYMIEGMGCPGGCVAGVGTCIDPDKAKILVGVDAKKSEKKVPEAELLETAERLTKME